MRIMLFTSIAVAALFCASSASLANEGPWCANVSTGSGGIAHDCHFLTVEDCVPSVIAGNRGFCTQNPRWPGWYKGAAVEPRLHRKRHAQAH